MQIWRMELNAKVRQLIFDIWRLFPKGGLDRCRLECLRVVTEDYGAHQSVLGFSQVPFDEDVKFGVRSMGLWYDNGHLERCHGHQMCIFSRKHYEFLLKIQECLYLSFRSQALREAMKKYMRVALVVGAQTGEHTDTMRGATPNFILIEPDSLFHLRVRLFPKFIHLWFITMECNIFHTRFVLPV